MCWDLFVIVFFGWLVGTIAKWVYPGDEKTNFAGTTLIGIVGSSIGGFLNWILGYSSSLSYTSDFAVSIGGALIACYLWMNRHTIWNGIKKILKG